MCPALFFIGAAPGRVIFVRVRDTFFPCVLEHFVALRHGVRQQGAVPFEMGVVHQPVPQVQQVAVAQAQFFAHAEGALPFEEAPQHHDDRAACPPGGLEGGGRENIEKCPAPVAPELDDGPPGVFVGMVVMAVALGTGQLAVVEKGDQPIIALLLVH